MKDLESKGVDIEYLQELDEEEAIEYLEEILE